MLDTVEVQEDDIVVAMTDGVIDNLWEHEVVSTVLDALERWEEGGGGGKEVDGDGEEMEKKDGGEGGKMPAERTYAEGMQYVAQELLNAARRIAEDPFAESPYMEKAIDEGLSIEGGTYFYSSSFATEAVAPGFSTRDLETFILGSQTRKCLFSLRKACGIKVTRSLTGTFQENSMTSASSSRSASAERGEQGHETSQKNQRTNPSHP